MTPRSSRRVRWPDDAGRGRREIRPGLVGRNWQHPRFPLLAKHIFTSDWLSVQVHPDDGYAQAHDPGSLGKCEMWYVVQADPHAGILLGLKPGLTYEGPAVPAFEKGKSKELLNLFRPEVNDAIFLPPGTIHAPGSWG